MVLEFLLAVAAAIAVVYIVMHVLYLALRQHLKDFRVQSWSQVDSKGYVRLYFVAAMQALHKKSGEFYPYFPGEKLLPVGLVDEDKVKNGSETHSQPRSTDPFVDVVKEYPGTKSMFLPPSDESSTVTDCHMDHSRLKLYRQCILQRDPAPESLPPCFMMSYFNKLLIGIGSSSRSRNRVLGCVHVRQQITIHKDISCLLHEPFSLQARSLHTRETVKGVEIDVRCLVCDVRGDEVWDAIITGVSIGNIKKSSRSQPRSPPPVFEFDTEELIKSKYSTGVECARATCDFQPQHINRLTCKIAGFDWPIAHGMWSMAVAMDRIMTSRSAHKDSYPLHADVHFKRPWPLATEALLRYQTSDFCDGETRGATLTKFQMVRNNMHETLLLDGRMSTGAKL